MNSKGRLDMDRIARGLGAERRGEVQATGGHFGAMQLAADVQARFRAPIGGGRSTDPSWTQRRLVGLAPRTLQRLEQLSAQLREQGVVATPLQVAALLLEHATEAADETMVAALAQS
jgi:hypothetical protein